MEGVSLRIRTNKPPSVMKYEGLASLENDFIKSRQILSKLFKEERGWYVWEYKFKNYQAYHAWESYRRSTVESRELDSRYIFYKDIFPS